MNPLKLLAAFAVVAAFGAWWIAPTTAAPSSLVLLDSPEHQALGLPFSEAARVGDLLFVSGQIGSVPGSTTLVKGGIQAETTQAMENIFAILARYGATREQIAKCTIFLGDMDEWGLMNVAYLKALGDHRPARSALGASGLALNGAVEIECIAAFGTGG
ncbi:MAG: RidA family protein [Pseudomonadota bacterium]